MDTRNKNARTGVAGRELPEEERRNEMAVETKNVTSPLVAGERPTTKTVVPKKRVNWTLVMAMAIMVMILGSIVGLIVYMALTSNFVT